MHCPIALYDLYERLFANGLLLISCVGGVTAGRISYIISALVHCISLTDAKTHAAMEHLHGKLERRRYVWMVQMVSAFMQYNVGRGAE
ncbi:hypothetical protein F5Y00DRAFT_33708 [Daldinia vernicosa]|uniref:uncharacterized protein n=1 Tax=Daldinia vernicosa TaxID=114800 RepID=UPI002007DC4D|nr:uncharacterized protein F5Y00DRAFT_33708 [Daldinia vernicosa]KAI0850595.1 hypothetical protein F5Y00DRAFT_33708 [Daldinia vernicosa]